MKRSFIKCAKCGNPLIERTENGLWIFRFGKSPFESGEPPILMKIYGSIKMRCWRHSCRTKYPDHWNVLNYFPFDSNVIGILEESTFAESPERLLEERR